MVYIILIRTQQQCSVQCAHWLSFGILNITTNTKLYTPTMCLAASNAILYYMYSTTQHYTNTQDFSAVSVQCSMRTCLTHLVLVSSRAVKAGGYVSVRAVWWWSVCSRLRMSHNAHVLT